MHKYNKIFVLTAILLLTSNCADFRPRVGPPWMQDFLQNGPKDGSVLFKAGWKDGCMTGVSVNANRLQRHFYRFTQDAELAQNKEYYTAWKTSYTYCQRYIAQYLRRNLI